ncbi:MAG TPA: hypothetical protein VGS62_10005 [Streptosporangiaceae bacterium]|nr:hypothetical protein [Streptosporangiaceae bacterium]
MTNFVVAAIAMLAGVIPCGVLIWRGTLMDAVVAYQAISSIVVMLLILLPEGFRRPGEFEFPILMGVLLLGSGLVYVRFLERWL